MQIRNYLFLLSTFVLALCVTSAAIAGSQLSNIERVAEQSALFVEKFNEKDANALGEIYKRNAVLKLPNALPTVGRDSIVGAWAGGFNAGLDFLTLTIDSLEEISFRKVLESGYYELHINTPGGPIVQTGTYAVQWKISKNPLVAPKIQFDTIDAD